MVKKLNLLSFVLGAIFLLLGLGLTVYNNFTKDLPAGRQDKKQVLPAKVTPSPSATPSVTVAVSRVGEVGKVREVRVIRVIDGDTVEVQTGGKKETVRLIGIDAPEISKSQCFGKESKTKAEEVLSNKNVQLEADQSQDEKDRFGRLLRYVFLNGSSFNQLMITEGFAKEYTYKTAYKYQSEFKNAQKEAQNLKKGLWSACI